MDDPRVTTGKDTMRDDLHVDIVEELLEESEKDAPIIDGEVSDDLDTVMEKLKKEAKEKAELEKQSEEEIKRYDKDAKQRRRKEYWAEVRRRIAATFDPDTYAGFIQNFESLLMVVFVDSVLLTLLFSILYGIYIILTFEANSMTNNICKFAGAVVIAIICIIIQVNVDSKPKGGA